MSTNKVFIGGNWKCNGTLSQINTIITNLNSCEIPQNADVVIAVPAIHTVAVKNLVKPDILVSSQDICIHGGVGAYTGEISATLLRDIGVEWAIVGHSERRTGFGFNGEPDSVVATKVKTAIAGGLSVIACVGEQLTEREAGLTMSVVSAQLAAISSLLSPQEWSKVVIAYEPVWAIGTGKVATPEQAQETHSQIREWLSSNVSPEIAANTRIIYGGSVKGSNAKSLLMGADIDGFLVGGASLLPEFVDIIQAAVVKQK